MLCVVFVFVLVIGLVSLNFVLICRRLQGQAFSSLDATKFVVSKEFELLNGEVHTQQKAGVNRVSINLLSLNSKDASYIL